MLAIVAAQIAVLVGTTLSYTVGSPVGGSIVLVAIGVYGCAALTRTAGRAGSTP